MSTARTRSNDASHTQGLLPLVQLAVLVNFLVIGAITYRFVDFESVRSALYIGGGFIIVSLVAALVPWARIDKRWSILVAIADLIAIAGFAASLDGFQPALSALAIVPLIWMAVQFGLFAATVGAAGAIAAAVVPFLLSQPASADFAAWGGVALATTTVIFIGAMVHLIGREQRRQAMRLRATQSDLRSSVALAHRGAEQLRTAAATTERAESALDLSVAFAEESASKLRDLIAFSGESTQALAASLSGGADSASIALSMIDSADTGLAFFTTDGNVALANSSARALHDLPASTGISLEGRVGHTTVIDEILHSASEGRAVDRVAFWVGEGSTQRSMVAASKIVTRPSGEVLGTVIATHDVTSLSETIRARDEFLSMLSHDLRSPLTSIIGYLEIIEDSMDVNAAGVTMEFAIIRRNAARILALADELRHTTNSADQMTQSATVTPRPAPLTPIVVDMHELRVSDAI